MVSGGLGQHRINATRSQKEDICLQTVKMALVGAGTWGANHARIYKAHPFADVVAICDRDRAKAEKVAQEEGIRQVYDDYEKMFAECDCDAVAIVTPDFAHAEIAVAAANAGKHVLIEKPLATTREDAFPIPSRKAVRRKPRNPGSIRTDRARSSKSATWIR